MNIKNQKIGRFSLFGLLSFVLILFLGQQVFAQNNIPNINGQWTYRAKVFESDGNDCVTDGSRNKTEQESIVTINQNGNQFTSTGGISYMGGRSPNDTNAIGEGTIVSNQIQSRYQNPNRNGLLLSWSGVLSPDGATISGNTSCISRGTNHFGAYSNEGSFGFTLTRRSQPSQNQPNSPLVTPPPNQSPSSLRQL